jgi:hypothetical protein
MGETLMGKKCGKKLQKSLLFFSFFCGKERATKTIYKMTIKQ